MKRVRKLCNTVASFKYDKSAISSHFSYFGGFISLISAALTILSSPLPVLTFTMPFSSEMISASTKPSFGSGTKTFFLPSNGLA